MNDCLFCKIVAGQIPAKKVYEDEHTFAFEDIDPKAPTHVLIVPKKHLTGLKEATVPDAEIIGHCHLTAAKIAKERRARLRVFTTADYSNLSRAVYSRPCESATAL